MASEEIQENNESTESAEDILKEEVKRYLDITWSDEDTNKSVDEYISTAKQYLNETTGSEIDFDEDLTARSLLKDHCRYQRNRDIEFFENNFLKSLTALRFKYAIKEEKNETEDE